MLRLRWPRSETAPRFALPAGTYQWISYRLVEGTWHVSATGELGAIEVQAGHVRQLEVGDAVRLALRAVPRRDGLQFQVRVAGEREAGLSVYRDGRRISLNWSLVDGHGEELGTGPLRYG